MTRYLERELGVALAVSVRKLPVVVVSGLRQTGKSTLLTRDARFADRTYLALDDFATLAAAQREPEALIPSKGLLTLDEIQKCPELLTAIKLDVDRHRRAGRFLLSGSANLALLGQVTESLAGRALYMTLRPMTRREIRGTVDKTPMLVDILRGDRMPGDGADPIEAEEILLGGMPPVCLGRFDPAGAWFRGYEQTYVERDVRQISQITDLVAFRTLAQLAALRTGQVLNASHLGRDAKLTAPTAGRYLSLLETSFLIQRVPPFLKNRSSRLIKSPKMYFTDSGLAAHLAGVGNLDAQSDEPLKGALLETYVVHNILALLEAHLPQSTLCFWHEQGRHEVDVVIETRQGVVAIEIKAATRWKASDLSGLNIFLERTPQCTLAILAYNGRRTVALGPKLWAIPLGHLLG